jgi:hypothetical protein
MVLVVLVELGVLELVVKVVVVKRFFLLRNTC